MADDDVTPDELAESKNSQQATAAGSEETDALLSRLRVIEDQPLAERAAAFVQLHDQLQSTLEGVDAQQHHG